MKDELKLKLHFTTSEEPTACKECQWGYIEPFDGFDGEKKYGVSCFIPDLEAMKGGCPEKLGVFNLQLKFYRLPAERLRAIYIAQKFTMRKIADSCGIKPAEVSEIVNGYRKPTDIELEKLCRLLGLSAREYELISLEYEAIDKAIMKKAEEIKEEYC